uniref:Uncharacterized protein n=1 Tax=Nitratidesulfovibrio vulgaris (strain DSM 19637 / Miyazaki F) TaxID=883 RepID=B8DJE7_NITV9
MMCRLPQTAHPVVTPCGALYAAPGHARSATVGRARTTGLHAPHDCLL